MDHSGNMIKDYRKIAMGIVKFSALFAFCSLGLFLFRTTKMDFGKPIDTNIFANYGTLIGGLTSAALSIASIFLIIQTINESRINTTKQQIESRFFELIKIHRENRNEIMLSKNGQEITFSSLIEEFGEIYPIVEKIVNQHNMKLKEVDIINISFLSFYFGLFFKTTTGNYSTQQSNRVLRNYTIKSNVWVGELLKSLELKKQELNSNNRFHFDIFMGHESILGHYYRHIYQTVKFIDDQPANLLNFHEKYKYVKVLRAQLSTQEQILFCFNSLSDLGKIWELDPSTIPNKKLITKYNLITNIPIGIFLSYFDIKHYYPNVTFEIDGAKTEERKRLESEYT